MELADLKGLGPKRREALAQQGIHTMAELLWLLPTGYLDTREVRPVATLRPGLHACVEVQVLEAPRTQYVRGLSIVRVPAGDDSGQLQLTWFNQPWNRAHQPGDRLLLVGKVENYRGRLSLQNPRKAEGRGLYPRYAPVGTIPGKVIGGWIEQALPQVERLCPENLPEPLLKRWDLWPLPQALRLAHQPLEGKGLLEAQRRIGFENLLLYQLALLSIYQVDTPGPVIPQTPGLTQAFWRNFGHFPTQAQSKVLGDVLSDMASGKAMRRLVQGDVGSGKTAVALAAALHAARAGRQSALMVPTEVLARQHLHSAHQLLEPLGIRCGLLLGGMPAAQRREALSAIEVGQWQLVIGTHALLSPGVRYHRLGLVITDEQHRFGVKQRQRLSDKAEQEEAHVLVMSATPIPRTLALILYGDLEVSVIDQLPPGRTPVSTHIVPESKRDEMYGFIRQQAEKGQQAYLVCPLVEESEQVEAKDAQAMYRNLLKGPLKGLRLGLTWGSQPAQEKEQVLTAFVQGALDVLVATTVIEVGVNVPNATVMVIEDAQRFGLSQLHQLRGRVGRGHERSWCFLLGEDNERLRTLCQTSDGFVIAQKDLQLRGPGDFLGTRQHGRSLPDSYGVGDMRLLNQSRQAAKELMTEPELRPFLPALLTRAQQRYAQAIHQIALH